jgi:hypothetical protein
MTLDYLKRLPRPLLALAVLFAPVVFAQGRAVTTSALVSVKLDSRAVLVTDKKATGGLLEVLNDAAAGLESRCADNEVIVWQGTTYTRAKSGSIINNTVARLDKGGYAYKPSPREMDGTTAITFFTALAPTKSLAGVWVTDDKSLVLAWCRLVPAPAEQDAADDTTGR